MEIGIGVPNAVLDVDGPLLLAWARRSEERGFSSLGSIGRVAYPTYEELTVFAAAAAVTERIGLFTDILLGPTRSATELAKQAATVDQLSGGRLTLGLAVGNRPDDYQASERDYASRGRRFDEQLRLLRQAWSGEPIAGSSFPVTPPPARDSGIPILVGGMSEAALRRIVTADGWTIGGAPPDVAAGFADRVRRAWSDAGRDGEPRMVALMYFSLGDTEDESRHNILTYYGHLGEGAEQLAAALPRSPEAIERRVAAFEEMGVDEVVFVPTVADVKQVDLLADVVR